jgi:hypothetical protein
MVPNAQIVTQNVRPVQLLPQLANHVQPETSTLQAMNAKLAQHPVATVLIQPLNVQLVYQIQHTLTMILAKAVLPPVRPALVLLNA